MENNIMVSERKIFNEFGSDKSEDRLIIGGN
jgi:hypothetical protein